MLNFVLGSAVNDAARDVVVCAAQRAHYRLFGETAATYESCSTSGYKHGRTETVRPCTNETLACSRLFEDASASVEQLQQAMKECDKQHRTLTLAALQGQCTEP